jgi:hypothetical protein
MWSSVFGAVTQFFTALSFFGSALEHAAKAVNHIAIMGEESAATLSDEARIVRKAKHAAMLIEHGVTEAQAQ